MWYSLWRNKISVTVNYCTYLTSVVDPSLPQVLQPPLSDPERSVSTQSLNSLELRETSSHQLPPGVTVRAPSSPAESFILNVQPSSQTNSSPRSKHDSVRKLSSCKDSPSFPEVDFPVRYVPLFFKYVAQTFGY